MIFLRGLNDRSSAGYVKSIQIWDKALKDSEILSECDCTLPRQSKRCEDTVVLVPDYSDYTSSSVLSNYKIGNNYWGRSRLNDYYAWIPGTNSIGEWLQMDLGKTRSVAGMVTQGRSDYWQWVLSYRVKVSDDGEEWTDVECGRIFDGNKDRNTQERRVFDYPVRARYVRIYPETYYGYMAIRAGVLLCESECSDGHLDYKLTSAFGSVTGGPSLEAKWGQGTFDANAGYRFGVGQGLELDESKCIKDSKKYSALIDVKLDSVDGQRALLTSNEWYDNGLFIDDGKFRMRPSPIICSETIRTGYYYKFGITHDRQDNNVTLYINGYPCASGSPIASDHFRLEKQNMIFLRGVHDHSSAGNVKRIQVWQRDLKASEMATKSGCTLPRSDDKCDAVVAMVPDYDKFKASSVLSNYKLGSVYWGLCRLNDNYAFIPGRNQVGEWLQMDLGKTRSVAGIVSQGRSDYWQWVTTYRVKVSDDEEEWKDIECGRIFDANSDRNTQVKNIFDAPVRARYVRIYPETYYGYMAIRAGVLLCEGTCEDGHMDFKLGSGLTSVTGGPSMETPWGMGKFDRDKGYNFAAGQGLELDQSKCIKKKSTFTVLMDVKLDKVDAFRSLLTSHEWYDNGLYVNDAQYTLKPTGLKCSEIIRSNYYYQYGVTRDGDGVVTMYINGYECASAKPKSSGGFALDPTNMIFLWGRHDQFSSGFVKRIQIWDKALSSSKMESESGCTLPRLGEKCDKVVQFVPENDAFSASSTLSNNKMGQNYYGRPRINDPYAWIAGKQQVGEWLQMDLGSRRWIAGIVSQGRNDYWQWVKTFRVKVADDDDGENWKDVECGRIFDANSDRSTLVQNVFDKPVRAKFVRIYPEEWYSYMAIRAGVLLCEAECAGGHLEYDMTSASLTSKTGGPSLETPWGFGKYNGDQGYAFKEGEGLKLDESKCIKNPKSYSVLMDVKLDKTDEVRALLTSDVWDAAGLAVANSKLQLRPSAVECDSEVIRPGYYYQFGITRSGKSGDIALYINGYKCAAGTPKMMDGFELEPKDMTFFKGFEEQSSAGSVKSIQVWNYSLSEKEMVKETGCALPSAGETCSLGVVAYSPSYKRFDASSTWGNVDMGKREYSRPRLNSYGGYVPSKASKEEWLQIDVGTIQDVTGVVLQGRSTYDQRLTTFRVQVSEKGDSWADVECGRIFDGNTDRNTHVRALFDKPIKARYVRIIPETWYSWPSFRAGVLLCQSKCKEGHLDYQMDGFISETGGPYLRSPWGDGYFIGAKGNEGVDFPGADLKYVNVEHSKCASECRNTESCVGYVTNAPSSTGCWLKSKMDRFTDNENRDSYFNTKVEYYQLAAPYGFRFNQGGGLSVPVRGCVDSDYEYSILFEARLEDVKGWKSLMRTDWWKEKGLFVHDGRVTMFPSAAGLSCEEDLKEDLFYKFGLTRKKSGKVKLYLNGLKCSQAFPQYVNGYAISMDDLNFFHDEDRKYQSSGYVRQIQVWSKPLSDEEMAKESGCHPGIEYVGACKSTELFTASYDKTEFSSVWKDDEKGKGNARGLGVNSKGSWIPEYEDMEQWMQIDLGKNRTVVGVHTQGEKNNWEVTAFIVRVSYDKKTWTAVDCRRIFSTDKVKEAVYEAKFSSPIIARYVRIYPVEWTGKPALRASVSLCAGGTAKKSPIISLAHHAEYLLANPCQGKSGNCNPCVVAGGACRIDSRCKELPECHPHVCAFGDEECYRTAFERSPQLGSLAEEHFSCKLYNFANYHPNPRATLREKCAADRRCKHEMSCGCIEAGASCSGAEQSAGGQREKISEIIHSLV